MQNVSATNPCKVVCHRPATYNAVKIQVNNPRVNANNKCDEHVNCNGVYNGVDIVVNNPKVETGNKLQHSHHKHNLYNYSQADCPVCCEEALANNFQLSNLPVNPVAYLINNKTTINAEFEFEDKKSDNKTVSVPEPNLTTLEEQKLDSSKVAFNGLNFKANKELEIVPPTEIKPDVDVHKVVENLSNKNFDVQAQQMEEIAKASIEDPQKAVPYIVTEIFSELDNIAKKDSSKLTPPTEKQVDIRKQIIINEIVKEQAAANKQDPAKVKLPYEISAEDIRIASEISPMEQAERNKEYALYTMAILTKVYADEVKRHTGNVVPLTDLPGASTIVDSLRRSENPEVRVAAIDALRYISRPEYKEEISSVLNIATKDKNPHVARNAAITLEKI